MSTTNDTYQPVIFTPFFKIIDLNENERYSLISGWGPGGLRFNDRKVISTNDGQSNWNSFQEADSAFISHGSDIYHSRKQSHNNSLQVGAGKKA